MGVISTPIFDPSVHNLHLHCVRHCKSIFCPIKHKIVHKYVMPPQTSLHLLGCGLIGLPFAASIHRSFPSNPVITTLQPRHQRCLRRPSQPPLPAQVWLPLQLVPPQPPAIDVRLSSPSSVTLSSDSIGIPSNIVCSMEGICEGGGERGDHTDPPPLHQDPKLSGHGAVSRVPPHGSGCY